MDAETNTAGMQAGETYDAWLIRRAREVVARARERSEPGMPDLDRELRLARLTGELCAFATSLADALEVQLSARETGTNG